MDRLPSPRVDGLIVRELAGELVVYDRGRHRAFCLNPTVASIWRSCEAGASPALARRRLADALGRDLPDEVLWLGLDQLRKAGLLDGAPDAPRHPSRREVLRRIGVAGAALLPVVAALAVPPAVAAASCACNAKTGTNACNSAHCTVGAACGKNCTKRCQANGNCA
jgi:hypothetical protein